MLYEQCTYVCIYFYSSLIIEVKKKTVLDPSKTCPRDYEKLLSSPSGAHVSRTALWSRAAAIRSGRTVAAALEKNNNNNNMQFGRRTTATQTNITIGRFVEHDRRPVIRPDRIYQIQ